MRVSTRNWIQERSPDESKKIITALALSHSRQGGEQGKRITDCINGGDFLSVCDFSVDYTTCTINEARNCRQAIAYFAKCTFIDLGKDRREVAKSSFLDSEDSCFDTNTLFRARAQGLFSFEPWLETVFFTASRKIARVLGECPSFEDLRFRFGPGATTSTKKRFASVAQKLQAGLVCSEDLIQHLSEILAEMPHLVDVYKLDDQPPGEGDWRNLWLDENMARVPVVIEPGIVDFVPKNAKTHRTIVKEPVLNTMVQAALGDYMSGRLQAFGLGTRDQSLNQRLACAGSLSGLLATLDLSSASDTISTELVYELLPLDWALMLDSARSSKVKLDGVVIKQEKFSSMGNGFTFPLETLIFWALSSSSASDDFASVYGDDIIVSTDSVSAVKRTLTVCGFSINEKKSYWAGPFRESCGGDYLRGIDIRPLYQKNLISGKELFRIHNFYVRAGDTERASLVKTLIEPQLIIYGPDGYGDGHLLGDWIPRAHKHSLSRGYGGVLFSTYKLTALRDERVGRKADQVLPFYINYVQETAYAEVILTDSLHEIFRRGHYGLFGKLSRRSMLTYSPEPQPEVRGLHGQMPVKAISLPGTYGYKKVSIYTFDKPS